MKVILLISHGLCQNKGDSLGFGMLAAKFLDSNNISIGIHYFKVLVQIHYSRSPRPPWGTKRVNYPQTP